MREEIHQRLNDIVQNDVNLQSAGSPIFKVYIEDYPAILSERDLPCVMWLPRRDSGYTRQSGINYDTDVEYEGRIYLSPLGTRLDTIQNIRVLRFPDLFAKAFLSRPMLGYGGDSGLVGMNGEISFKVTSDLARPVEYPIGRRDNLFWGFTIQLIVPFEQAIEVVA